MNSLCFAAARAGSRSAMARKSTTTPSVAGGAAPLSDAVRVTSRALGRICTASRPHSVVAAPNFSPPRYSKRPLLAAGTLALVVRRLYVQGADPACPGVERQQAPRRFVLTAHEDLQRLDCLQARDDVRCRHQHTRRVAGRQRAGRRQFVPDAAQARRAPRHNGQDEPLAAQARAVDPRRAALHGEVIDQEARLHVVAAVQQQVGPPAEVGDVPRREVRDDAPRSRPPS